MTIACNNPYCRRFGKRIGEVETSQETISLTITVYCGTCRSEQRHAIRVDARTCERVPSV
jgi:hypothetical protein